jgi:hypothetical protein
VRVSSRIPSWVVALGVYALVGLVLLAPSIRPGRTVVPVDILEAAEPFRSLPPQHHVHEPAPSDAPFQFLGWWTWMGHELRTGHVPEWNPDVLGGVPVEPNGFVSPAYPFAWLVRFMAPFDAYNAFVVVHLVIAAMGAYALARRLGARAAAATVGGLGAFGAAMLVHLSTHLTHLVAIAWAGLVLAGVHYAARTRGGRAAVAFAAPLGLAWLGGGTQFAYFLTLAAGGFGLALAVLGNANRARAVARVGIGLGLGIALAAPVFVPTLRVSDDVLRSREPSSATVNTHLPLADGLRFVLPQWRHPDGVEWGHDVDVEYAVDSPFVGVAVLVLAAAALGAARRRADVAITFAAAAIVALLAWVGPLHRALYAVVPGYDHFRVSGRWIFLLAPLVVPLCAVGLSELLRRDRAALRLATGAAGFVGAVALAPLALGAVVSSIPVSAFASDALFAVAIAVTLAVSARTRALLAVAAVVLIVEAGAHTTTWYGAHREADALPALPAVTTRRDTGRLIRLTPALTQLPPLLADVPLAYGLSDASGWAVFLPRDIDAYMNRVEEHGAFARTTNVEPALTKASSLASPLLDMLNVSTVLVDPGVGEPVGLPLVSRMGDVRVYSRPSALGPATIVGGHGTARLVDETSDTQRYTVDVDAPATLRVSGRYDAGWSARVDGHRVKVRKADGLFRSVAVPSGRHEVTWRYRNPDARTGRLIGLAAVLACAGLATRRRRVLGFRGAGELAPPPGSASFPRGGSLPS